MEFQTNPQALKAEKLREQLRGLKDLNELKPKLALLQLIAKEGMGARRVAFHFLKADQKVLWIAPEWKLYAPTLWKLAQNYGVKLYGMECPERERLRLLLNELRSSDFFNVWVLDGFSLNMAEGHFLQNLLTSYGKNGTKAIVIDPYPHSFCVERVHIHPSEHSYRLSWSKGGPKNPQFMSSEFLEEMKSDWRMNENKGWENRARERN